VPIVILTARPPRVARVIAEAAGTRGPLICCNGALVYDPEADAVLGHAPLAAAHAAALVVALRAAVPGACFAVEMETRFGQEPAWAALVAAAVGEPFETGTPSLLADALELCRVDVTKLIVRHPEHSVEALAEVVRELAGAGAAVTHSGGPFVELSAAGVDKASALAALCADLAIPAGDVIAFGDMPNDLPMLRWAGRSVAVANAHPAVLAAADEITASNAEDGVALVLERLLA